MAYNLNKIRITLLAVKKVLDTININNKLRPSSQKKKKKHMLKQRLGIDIVNNQIIPIILLKKKKKKIIPILLLKCDYNSSHLRNLNLQQIILLKLKMFKFNCLVINKPLSYEE